MAIQRCYRCPDCEQSFWVTLESRNQPPPDDCPMCHGTGEAPPKPQKAIDGFPHIAKSIGRVADGVYRQMESASEARAEAAAEMMGGTAAETGLKMTDMSDTARAGEMSVKTTVSPDMQRAVQAPGAGIQGFVEVAGHIASARSGPGADMAERAGVVQSIFSNHAQTARAVAAQGEMGRHKGNS